MRTFSTLLLLAPFAALAAPDVLAAFEPALEQLPMPVYNATETSAPDGSLELLKRANNNCATNYFNCANLGASGLCCPRTAVCSADQAGHVACCPQGAACTGAIAATTSGTVSATSTGTFVFASTTTSQPFVQATTGSNHGSTLRVPAPIQAVKAMLQVARAL